MLDLSLQGWAPDIEQRAAFNSDIEDIFFRVEVLGKDIDCGQARFVLLQGHFSSFGVDPEHSGRRLFGHEFIVRSIESVNLYCKLGGKGKLFKRLAHVVADSKCLHIILFGALQVLESVSRHGF